MPYTMVVKRFFLLLVFLASFLLLTACQKEEAQKMFSNAYNLWEDEKYDEAVQHFIALTKAYPNSDLVDDSLYWIGNIYEHYLKEPEQAIRFYRSLNKKFENSEYFIPSMISLARVYSERDEEDKRRALLIYQKLQKILPSSSEEWDQNQINLSNLHFSLKQYDLCRIELKTLVVTNANSKYLPNAFYLIGYSYYTEGQLNLAKIAFKEASTKFKASKDFLDVLPAAMSLADVYEELGELSSAIDMYAKILDSLEKNDLMIDIYKLKIKKLENRLKKTSN